MERGRLRRQGKRLRLGKLLERRLGSKLLRGRRRRLRLSPPLGRRRLDRGEVRAVIALASGQAYGDFLHDRIFAPLGMADTGIEGPGIAIGYLHPGVKAAQFAMSEVGAAGALYSTVADLLRWDQALLTGAIASRASLDAILRPHIAQSALVPSHHAHLRGRLSVFRLDGPTMSTAQANVSGVKVSEASAA